MIVKKKNNDQATTTLLEIASWLHSQGISVLVEPQVFEELQSDVVETWNEEVILISYANFKQASRLGSIVDFVITLGGDGTLLFASTLFPVTMPPVVSFHMGSLGFLTPFSAEDYKGPLSSVRTVRVVEGKMIRGDVPLTVRTRLEYHIIRYSDNAEDDDAFLNMVSGRKETPKLQVRMMITTNA